MEIQQLRHFRAVAEQGSFTRAAASCRVSQQAVSQSLSRLEQALGVRLLERTSGGLTLTRFGALLLPRAVQMLEEERLFRRELRTALGAGEARLRLGVSPTAEAAIVPEAVRAVLHESPDLSFEVRPGLFPELRAGLLDGRLDLFVSVQPEVSDETLLVAEVLGEVEYLAVASAAGSEDPVWVMGDNPPEIRAALARRKWKGRGDPALPRVLSYSTVFIKAFLQAEDAATVLPRATITTELESGRLRRIGGQGRGWYRPVVMCTRRSALPPPALALTMEAIRRSAKRILTQR